MVSVSLAPFEDSDLDWLLEVEARAREEGFLRGNDRAGHIAYMAEPHSRYLKILSEGERAGYVMLGWIGRPDEVIELGRIAIDEPFRGIGQDAIRLILNYIFDEFGAHKVYLDTLDHNHRGRHIYEKLGFRQEGLLREHFMMGDTRRDMFVYGLLRSDWERDA